MTHISICGYPMNCAATLNNSPTTKRSHKHKQDDQQLRLQINSKTQTPTIMAKEANRLCGRQLLARTRKGCTIDAPSKLEQHIVRTRLIEREGTQHNDRYGRRGKGHNSRKPLLARHPAADTSRPKLGREKALKEATCNSPASGPTRARNCVTQE